jgi:hypothetical protein
MNKLADLILPDPQSTEYASEMDRLWFEQHPGEDERVRPPFPQEWCIAGTVCTAVHVVQLRPGVRARMPALAPQGAV